VNTHILKNHIWFTWSGMPERMIARDAKNDYGEGCGYSGMDDELCRSGDQLLRVGVHLYQTFKL